MPKRMTIQEVAAQAGVSRQTVSRVLNGKLDVAEATRQRVAQAISDLGYNPLPAAQGLARGHIQAIGLILPYTADYLFSDPHLLRFICGVDHIAGQRGASLMLATAAHGEPLAAYRRLADAGEMGGVIVVETGVCAEGAAILAERGYPQVILGYCPAGEETYAVHADDYGGARQATMHLLSLGHRRIGVLCGDAQSPTAIQQRLDGCRQALADHGLELDAAHIAAGDLTPESGYRAAAQLLAHAEPPSAIFALNDQMAVGALRYLYEHREQFPETISVVGFDDVPIAETLALTTVRQPSLEMGHQAARLLFELIDGHRITLQPIVLPTELVVRASTRPPAG